MLTLVNIKNEIAKDLKEINNILSTTLLKTTDPTLTSIHTHLLNNKGKQIRASLMILIHQMIEKPNPEESHKIAAAIELIHLASLVHDDIIDKANIRRDQETVNKKFGFNNGVISGVHIYANALQLISNVGNIAVLNSISTAVVELCEGESYQVNNRHNYMLSTNEYWNIIYLKTSALFRATCKSGAILNGFNENEQNLFNEFGSILGDIFQLTDDYLDIFDTKNQLSKKIEQDLITGDISLPILIAIQQVKTSITNESPTNQLCQIKDTLNTNKQSIASEIKTIIMEKKTVAENLLNIISHNTKSDTTKISAILDLIVNRV